jgi:uncharacterized protein YdeI (BOF family)
MRIAFFLIAALFLASCAHNHQHQQGTKETAAATASTGQFGNEVAGETAMPVTGIAAAFMESDTARVTVSGNIAAACKHSGCWMDMDMGDGNYVHVTFKDEAFTIPLDAAGKDAVAQGLAVRTLIPVETLRNYAKEEGKSEEEIAAITQPAYAYELIAEGVLIRE